MSLERIEELEGIGPKNLVFRFERSPLYGLETVEQLAHVLGVPVQRIWHFARHVKDNYVDGELQPRSRPWILGRPRRPRPIKIPKKKFKALLIAILKVLKKEPLPPYVSAPRKHRTTVSNAGVHRRRKEVGCVDIESFYDYCHASAVFRLFNERFQCSKVVSDVLTRLVCLDGHLPTGTPTSPLLAFLANEEMFNHLYLMAWDYGCRMSLWIDDLTFSVRRMHGTVNDELVVNISNLLRAYGFRLKQCKVRIYRPNQPALVCGVIIMPNGELRLPNYLHHRWHLAKEVAKSARGKLKERAVATAKSLKRDRLHIEKSNRRYHQQSEAK